MDPIIYSLDELILKELSKPGIRLFLFGSDKNGMPYEQKMIDIFESDDEEQRLESKVVVASYASVNYLQNYMKDIANTNNKLAATYAEVKERINNSTGEESKEHLPDEARFLQLRTAGVKLKRTNKDCNIPEELELLKIYRRLDDRKRKILQSQVKMQSSGFV